MLKEIEMELLNSLLATPQVGGFWNVWHPYLRIITLVIMAICAIFIICVVMFQPGNSSGVGALGGQTETFLGKNKKKTTEHKLKVLTVISAIIFGVLCIVFFVISALFVVA